MSQQCQTVLTENVMFWSSWNFVQLFITSSTSWMYHHFLFLYMVSRDNWHFLCLGNSFKVGFFLDTIKAGSYKLCMLITLLRVYIGLDDLEFVSRSCVSETWTANWEFWSLVLCSLNVVWLLHTLKILCTLWFVWLCCVFKGDNMFLVGQASGLVENFNIGIYSDIITVINAKLCMMD